MSWALEYSDRALRQLRKLDPGVRRIILSWMDKNVAGCEDPRAHGKALVANRAGSWRYRVGDYRVLCRIEDARLVVVALEVAHRSTVYR